MRCLHIHAQCTRTFTRMHTHRHTHACEDAHTCTPLSPSSPHLACQVLAWQGLELGPCAAATGRMISSRLILKRKVPREAPAALQALRGSGCRQPPTQDSATCGAQGTGVGPHLNALGALGLPADPGPGGLDAAQARVDSEDSPHIQVAKHWTPRPVRASSRSALLLLQGSEAGSESTKP